MDSTINPPRSDSFTQQMREQFLTEPPSGWEIEPTPEYPTVYGVLMEWPSDDIVMTVVAFCEGSASLYGSDDSGVIGGHAHELVSSEARTLVKAAAELCDEARPAFEFPYPGPGHVRFYLLTFTGVRMLEGELGSMLQGQGRYAGLYQHGFRIFERLLAIAAQRTGDEGDARQYPRE